MWFYICFSIVFVSIFSPTNSVKHDRRTFKNPSLDTDFIIADVIKNISQVNNVLHELITNYKHLQKTYKSQEELETTSSDDEVDKDYDIDKKDKRARSKFETTTVQNVSYPGTKMIYWSSNETSDTESVGLKEPKRKPEKVTKKSKVNKHEQINSPVEAKLTLNQFDSSSEYEIKDKSQSQSIENVKPYETIRNKVSTGLPIVKQGLEPKQSEIIFIDTYKTTREAKNTSYVAPEKVYSQSIKGLKTRYSKVDSPAETSDKRTHKNKFHGNNAPELISDPYKINTNHKIRVEKKIPSQAPSSLWDSIIMNKPIQIEPENGITYKKLRKDNRGSKKPIFRSESIEKKTLVNVTHENKTKNIKPNRKAHLPKDTSETEEDIIKEEFKASVLREAYGDACLKVVVRKCFKACKASGKSVCEKFKCKDNYKDKFAQFSKAGCIKEFVGSVKNTKKNDKKSKSSKNETKSGVKNRADQNQDDDDFSDFTRDGYLRACLPLFEAKFRRTYDIVKEKVTTKTVSHSSSNKTLSRKTFNILRDRYEKACKKVSYGKCLNACRFAHTEVCKSFTCNDSRKKAYNKSCVSKCKEAYDLKSSDSESDSESDSYSDSDSESDSDKSSKKSDKDQ